MISNSVCLPDRIYDVGVMNIYLAAGSSITVDVYQFTDSSRVVHPGGV